MNKLLAITANTFLQTVRQPIYAILVLATLGSYAIAPSITAWTLDDDNKLLRDMGLSTLLIQGLFLAAFSAAAAISVEIEDKTVLTTVSKPVMRGLFVVGKYLGVLAAVAVAHYVATIGFVMCLRHGVLQTAAEHSDYTVILLGPGLVLVMLLAAGLANYAYDWKFLPTAIALIVPALTVSIVVLSFVDREWKISKYETKQDIDRLPDDIPTMDLLKGIIEFRPGENEKALPGASGQLVHHNWRGPISDADREYLLNLSKDFQWRQRVNFLVTETRKITTPDLLKAAYLILLALALLSAIAVAASTRLGTLWTLIVCVIALCVGFVTDHYLEPLDANDIRWAQALYRLLPNFQLFWMVDALSDDRIIPWSYVGRMTGYTTLYVVGLVALAAAMFEQREVG